MVQGDACVILVRRWMIMRCKAKYVKAKQEGTLLAGARGKRKEVQARAEPGIIPSKNRFYSELFCCRDLPCWAGFLLVVF